MRRYLILIEPTGTGFSAYSPDLPGCAATGATRDDVERTMRDAVELHVEGLRELGEPVPPPSTSAAYVEIAA
jgi:predicted RNase H-like HicB family nuclease